MFAFRLGAETIFGVVFFVQLLNVVDVASVNIGAISKGEVISIAAGELNSSNELVAVTSDEGGVGINDLNIVLGTSLVQLIPLDVDSLNGSSAARGETISVRNIPVGDGDILEGLGRGSGNSAVGLNSADLTQFISGGSSVNNVGMEDRAAVLAGTGDVSEVDHLITEVGELAVDLGGEVCVADNGVLGVVVRVDIALKGIGRETLNGEDLNVVAVHIGGSERVGDTVDRRSANRVGGSVHPSARVILVEVAVAQSDTVNGVGIAATGGRVDDGVHVAVVPADSIDGGLLTVEVAGGGPNAGLVVEGSLLASIEEHAGDLGLGGISLDEDILGEVVAHDVVDLIILITVDLVEAGNRLEGIRAGSGVITGADQVHSVGVGNKAAGDLGVLVNSQVLAVEILVSGGSAGTTDLNSLDSAVSLSAELEHIVVQDLSAGLVGAGILIDIVVDVEVARGRGAVGIAGHDLKGSGVVGQFAALSDIRSVAVLGGSTIVDEGADVENGGGAVHVGHVSSGNASAVSSVASPPDGVDHAVAGSSSDLNVTDEVAILVEEPGVVPGGVASLIEDELDSIIIDSASNIVLLVVPVDDALSAVNRSGLGNDLAVLVSAGLDEAALGSAVNSVGEGVQENVIADSIRIRILAVGEGERGSSGGVLGGIDIELDGSLGAQVALSVISGRSNIGDLGEEGVDHDDNVIIFSQPNTRRLSRFPVVAAKIFKSSNCCKNDKESQKIGRINAKNVRFSCYCIPLATRKKPAAQWLCGPVVVAVW